MEVDSRQSRLVVGLPDLLEDKLEASCKLAAAGLALKAEERLASRFRMRNSRGSSVSVFGSMTASRRVPKRTTSSSYLWTCSWSLLRR